MSKVPVLAWYFPNWHPDARNDEWHGKGWTEWEVSKCARARFEGHEQPRVPLWGYLDESDPAVMEKKIDTALAYGVDGFLWDIYWFEDGGYRFRALDEGFFGAKNNEKFKIALMWCNHDPIYVHPASRMFTRPSLMAGELSPQAFFNGSQHFIDHYFGRSNYMRVDGKVFFVLWDVTKFVNGLGGMEGAKLVIRDFRRRVHDAGLGELHLAANIGLVPGTGKDRALFNDTLKALGFDSCVRYSWPLNGQKFPDEPFEEFLQDGIATFEKDAAFSDLPMGITVSSGWDCSPRTVQSEMYGNFGYPFSTVITGATPEKYEKGLRAAKEFVDSGKFTGHFVTLSTWNEWTEGNYLEPDTKDGYGYLEAVKRVFGE